ncbi:hypothetical protein GCM10009592_26500 [Brachybacterium rhamnosum]|uniref:Tail assembly chaperone n=1 Tax=Brachybacterium rhamnosum TaxID=173361 RepID=A0ABW4Q1D0_9MICO
MAAKTSSTAEKAKAAGAKVPGDHEDTAAPEKKIRNVRVLSDEVTLEWDGDTYTIDREAIDDVDFVLELEQGKQVSAAVRLLGPEGWSTFKATHREGTRVPYSEAEAFLVALLEQLQKVANSGN